MDTTPRTSRVGETQAETAGLQARYRALFQQVGAHEAAAIVQQELLAMAVGGISERVMANVPPELLWHPEARVLREMMDPIGRVLTVVELGKAGKLAHEVARETAELVNRFEPGQEPRKSFWNWAIRALKAEELWDVAPTGVRKIWPHLRPPQEAVVMPGTTPALPPQLRRKSRKERLGPTSKPAEGSRRSVLMRAPQPSAEERWNGIDWAAETSSKALDQVVQEAVTLAMKFFPLGGGEATLEGVPKEVLFHELAQPIRDILGDDALFEALAMWPQASDNQLGEVSEHFCRSAKVQPHDAVRTWDRLIRASPNRERLAGMEPRAVRVARHKIHHRGFFEAYAAIPEVAVNIQRRVTFGLESAYGQVLTEEDKALARSWAGDDDTDTDFRLAQMLSARAAEKLVMLFYRHIGCGVEDVARQQLLPDNDGDWMTHDLRVDGRPVDVKNARPRDSQVDGRRGYAEHIVKRFKRDARAQDVTIVGVRSPFLQTKYLEAPTNISTRWRRKPNPVQVLGECTSETLAELRREFTKQPSPLEDLALDRGRKRYGDEEFLPPWVFSYPGKLYDTNGYRMYRKAVDRFVKQPTPEWEIVVEHGLNPLPFFTQTGTPLPDSWREQLRVWEVEFVERIGTSKARDSLPHLFLTILTDFLLALQVRREEYDPRRYRRFLYSDVEQEAMRHHLPLGIYDPLRSVADMLSTLERLWVYRGSSRIQGFTRFEFTAAGLLRGSRPEDGKRVSLLAWCGGCGASDLVLGVEEACGCGYLICSACRYCRAGCEEGKRRQANA